MGFENRVHNGKNYKVSDDVFEWKIVHRDELIICLGKNTDMIGTIHSTYTSPNFRSMMQYIKNNNLDVSSIELYNKEEFISNVVGEAIRPNDDDLIEFCNTLNFI